MICFFGLPFSSDLSLAETRSATHDCSRTGPPKHSPNRNPDRIFASPISSWSCSEKHLRYRSFRESVLWVVLATSSFATGYVGGGFGLGTMCGNCSRTNNCGPMNGGGVFQKSDFAHLAALSDVFVHRWCRLVILGRRCSAHLQISASRFGPCLGVFLGSCLVPF